MLINQSNPECEISHRIGFGGACVARSHPQQLSLARTASYLLLKSCPLILHIVNHPEVVTGAGIVTLGDTQGARSRRPVIAAGLRSGFPGTSLVALSR